MMNSQAHARRLARTGWWIVLGAVAPLGAWMSLAPLSMAVVAPAFVKIDLNRRPVQHLEGGIVRSVLVRDGQRVNAGDAVLILGDVSVDAERNRLAYRAHVEQAGIARLDAEQARAATMRFPAALIAEARRDSRVQEAIAKEESLFRARRDSLTSETKLLAAQRERIEQEIGALRSQIAQVDASLALQKSELETNRRLLKDGFISPARIVQLEAIVADYGAKLEERRSELARAGQRIGDVDLRVQSLQNEYVKTASDQLKISTARLAEIEQELRKSEDAAARQVVAAPATGEVIDLKFTSPGAVVRAGDSIADIVPLDASLMLEARIRPEDISNVRLEQPARIKFTAYKYRNLTLVSGKVTYVSGDRMVDRATNQPYYSVLVTADAQSLQQAGELRVQAGMPAEVYIRTDTRTAADYLLAPVTNFLRRGMREPL